MTVVQHIGHLSRGRIETSDPAGHTGPITAFAVFIQSTGYVLVRVLFPIHRRTEKVANLSALDAIKTVKEGAHPYTSALVLKDGKANVIRFGLEYLLHRTGRRPETEEAENASDKYRPVGILQKAPDALAGDGRIAVHGVTERELLHAGMVITQALKEGAHPCPPVPVGKYRVNIVFQCPSVGQFQCRKCGCLERPGIDDAEAGFGRADPHIAVPVQIHAREEVGKSAYAACLLPSAFHAIVEE